MVQMASQGVQAEKPVTVTDSTQMAALPERLMSFQKSAKLTQRALARQLGLRLTALNRWCQGRAYPPKRYWPVLAAAGICTAADLAAWRPRRPARYSLRGARVYGLAEYAAKG